MYVNIKYLTNQGFECIEDDYNNNIILDKVDDDLKVEGITQVKKDNFNSFKIIHDQIEGDMYWNSERILRDFDNWIILIKENDNIPEGAVYYMESRDGDYEIFGILNDERLEALKTKHAEELKQNNSLELIKR